MSGANFKVWVPLPDGRRCGIDVFGSFHIGDRFYVTGSLHRHPGPLRAAAVRRPSPSRVARSPRRPTPEEVLAFTYGPDWRVPDPAFHFDHDPVDVRRMDAWFRATAPPAALLARLLQEPRRGPGARPSRRRSRAWAQQRIEAGGRRRRVLDVGAGTGRDAAYFADQGHRVTALDFTTLGLQQTQAPARAGAGHACTCGSHQPRGPALGAGHRRPVRAPRRRPRRSTPAACSTRSAPSGRDNLWRFASMVQRRGGETFLEFRTPRSRREREALRRAPAHLRRPGRRRARDRRPTAAPSCTARPAATWPRSAPRTRRSARLVVRWTP